MWGANLRRHVEPDVATALVSRPGAIADLKNLYAANPPMEGAMWELGDRRAVPVFRWEHARRGRDQDASPQGVRCEVAPFRGPIGGGANRWCESNNIGQSAMTAGTRVAFTRPRSLVRSQ